MMDAVTLVSANPAWWLLAISLMVAGVAGAILPVLPGTLLVLAGVFVGAWIDGFTRVSGWTVGFIAVLALLAWATDYLAALLGAKKAGASPMPLSRTDTATSPHGSDPVAAATSFGVAAVSERAEERVS